MSERIDRLYELLPVVYRQRDVAQGNPLRDLLRVIAEQVELIEDDIAQMYDDWFIETCRDWVVPYIGDLTGYSALRSGEPGDARDPETARRARAIAPRSDVANYIRDLRARGTLALIELLANDSGFPARAVELFTLLGKTQALDALDARGRFVDLRDLETLEQIDGPFDAAAHTVDVRRLNAPRVPGLHNIPNAAAYVWRLRSFPVTHAPAYFLQAGAGFFFYDFSALGNDGPLFANPRRELDPTTIAAEINVPVPIRRRALDERPADYYGAGKSFAIWLDGAEDPVPIGDIIPADLSDWKYRPPAGKVAVDPQLGRFALGQEAKDAQVSYRYGFSGDVGAHESPRMLRQPRDAVVYRVGAAEEFASIGAAVAAWQKEKPPHAVIEIADNGMYVENIIVELQERTSLQIRAANRCRPIVRVLDVSASAGEALHVDMHDRSRFTLDGILLLGRPLGIHGVGKEPPDVRVTVRRCTLVPGLAIRPDGEPIAPVTPNAPNPLSLELNHVRGKVSVESSISGTIGVLNKTTEGEPVALELRDSILDATAPDLEALIGPGRSYAWTTLSVIRCTVFGTLLAHAVELGENSIFDGVVRVVRRQHGCMRFCWIPPGSRTPRRYHCQPDLVEQAAGGKTTARAAEERLRVAPRFNSKRFARPDYAQLAFDCAPEIARGADDESEMGAFHDLFLPQRAANLRARIEHSTPAGMESGIIYAD
jgi:hypothetical protein